MRVLRSKATLSVLERSSWNRFRVVIAADTVLLSGLVSKELDLDLDCIQLLYFYYYYSTSVVYTIPAGCVQQCAFSLSQSHKLVSPGTEPATQFACLTVSLLVDC